MAQVDDFRIDHSALPATEIAALAAGPGSQLNFRSNTPHVAVRFAGRLFFITNLQIIYFRKRKRALFGQLLRILIR